ncbi:unnamed protein product [Allacma fusca]|uniref:Methyltransferase FkbM domain-containing protein n=1 Tax=Allacma fusca TaxID=39272 RepID=A0A8J2PP92_9HEXA|nr:unnamed protein product [Allacma fusca]
MPFHFVRVDYAARRKILLLLLILMLFGCYKLMPSLSNSEQEIQFLGAKIQPVSTYPPSGVELPSRPPYDSSIKAWLQVPDGTYKMDPKLLKSLKTKHRNAWIAGVCVSPHNNFTELELIMGDQINYWSKGETFVRTPGNMNDKEARNLKKSGFMVECFPLVSQLAAINITHVDFLSLDVQGLEMDILATILVDSGITVDYILAEHTLIPNGKNSMKEFLISKGYELIFDHFNDFLFKRRIINTN